MHWKLLKDERELVSIATLKQRLDVQQSMLKTLFDSFISTVNARVDKLADSVASLKASLEFTQKDVGDLSSLKSKLVGAEKDIVEIKNSVELHGNKIEYQENQSRRNNIRVFGIPESAGETWEMAETKVKDAIKKKLNIEVDIECSHSVLSVESLEESMESLIVNTCHSFPNSRIQ